MAQSPKEFDDVHTRFAEVVKEARAIAEQAEEANNLFMANNIQSASEMLALSHYKVSSYNKCKDALLNKLAELGIVPGQAERGSD